MAPRINWNAIEREEQQLEDDLAAGLISTAEYHREVNALHRAAREEYAEAQWEEFRDECGW